MWRIRLLGAFAAERDGRAVSLDGLRQRERALLAILALRRGVVPRDELAETVFGHLAAERVAANLRVALSRLRAALGEPAVVQNRDGGHALADAVQVDVGEFEAHADRARAALREGRADTAREQLEAALDIYQGDVIPLDLSVDWEEPLRARLRGRRVAALEDLVDAYLSLGRPRDASATAERALEIDRTRESAYRRLMTAHYAAGEQDAALAAYERCRRALSEELGVDPLPETMSLHERILRRAPIAVSDLHPSSPAPAGLRFVARAAERIAAEATVARAAQECVFMLVVGEPGAGKTRFAHEVLGQRTDVALLATRCYELERDLPFSPLREALGDRTPASRTDLPPDEGRAALIQAYAHAVLATAQGRPLVWSIDDVQWADRSTLDVLHFVARRAQGARVAIVAIGREDELQPDHPIVRLAIDMRREGRAERVALMPLEPADVLTLARASGISAERAASVHARSGGNAFFATELIAALRRGSTSLPETARDAILARTHALSANGRAAIQAAAVLGGRFRPREVAGIAQLDDDAAARALGELEGHDLLRPLNPAEYELAHELVREAVYGDIPQAMRTEMHARAIDVISETRGWDGASLVCYHAELAQNAECAFACAAHVGERALADNAGNEALASFDRALSQPSDPESRRRCLTLRAEAKRRLGMLEDAAADLTAAAALGNAPVASG